MCVCVLDYINLSHILSLVFYLDVRKAVLFSSSLPTRKSDSIRIRSCNNEFHDCLACPDFEIEASQTNASFRLCDKSTRGHDISFKLL